MKRSEMPERFDYGSRLRRARSGYEVAESRVPVNFEARILSASAVEPTVPLQPWKTVRVVL
jgi:hypothetical protein